MAESKASVTLSSKPHEAPRSDGQNESTFLRRIGRWTTANLSGWKMGIVIAASTTTIALIANIGFTLWGVTHSEPPMAGGIGTLIDGSCDKVRRYSLWLHLGINALSTLMLSGSNYTQQCLAAPTRHEVDVAHSKRKWLNIGVLAANA
ncbi:uncharacterized protein A1O9_00508 [Exophiala aquamarina CBS 119918]|uniref:DUF6536 domain-containing protein n=1 Tax=Exophiala aquamarina CBS 119918 TaxID=1182545 RepID=A0A072Q3Q1_9EURO|nr:uncharacterized protein A1O9_00508 [Exophiala aquamarina CBS 119918]KEF62535.1 hypothetical protein A1O9_00508 [Exophiala aquamarina CBS 119918]